jgi:hypothetical protein
MKADWRLIVLLALAIVFTASAIQPQPRQPVYIEGNFIDFDTAEVFDMPILEEDCLEEPSPLYPLPAL